MPSVVGRQKKDKWARRVALLPDLPPGHKPVLLAEAETITRCCRQTLWSIVDKGKLPLYRVVVDGRARQAFGRNELTDLFVKRPEPGEPIKLSSGETFFLRADGKKAFNCSDVVFYYWSKKDSRRHPGNALRFREFYIIGERSQGPPKLQTAWRGEDLTAIAAGQEGECPERGRGHGGIAHRRQLRETAKKFMREIKAKLPMIAGEAVGLCEAKGITGGVLYGAKKKAKIVTRRVRGAGRAAVFWWCLRGQAIPTCDQSSSPKGYATNSVQPRLKRGPDPDPNTEAMSAACYLEYVTNRRSRKDALKIVKESFPGNAPSSPDALKVYARRYAVRHKLAWR